MLDLIDINEKVFDYLEEERKSNPKLTYTLRKSNYSDRLAEGYWFYGTENYLSVSFWSGMDWKNRTPNISFIILQNGETFLEINVSDSFLIRFRLIKESYYDIFSFSNVDDNLLVGFHPIEENG